MTIRMAVRALPFMLLGVCLAARGLAADAMLSASATGTLSPWLVIEERLRPESSPVRASFDAEESWSGRSIATVAEAFREIPGALMQESHGGFEPPRLSIRGSGIQSAPSSRGVTLLFNEFPLGLADGSFNSALLDPMLGESIAVQRGLDGWRRSPAVAGGAIDIRRRASGQTAAALRVEAGSFGAARAHATGSLTRDGLGATGGFSFAQQEGYREHNAQARTALFGLLERSTAGGARVDVEAYHAHGRYEVPGPLTFAAAIQQPRSISADVRRDQPRRVSEISRLATSVVGGDAGNSFEFGAAFTRTDDELRQLQANGVTRSQSNDGFLRFAYARRFILGGMAHQLGVNANGARGSRDQRRFLNDNGNVGAIFGHDGLVPTTLTTLLEDTVALAPKLAGTIGVARVDARRDISDRLGAGPSSSRKLSSGATLPGASLRWKFTPDTVAFVSTSRAAEPATFDDLLFVVGAHPALVRRSQPLATQRAETWEVGARGRTGSLSWEAAVYHSTWHNEILRLADATGLPRGAVNSTPTVHDGIETSARWVLCERPWRITLSSTAVWTQFRFDGDPVYGRNRLAGIPPHLGNAGLTVEWPKGAFVAATTDWSAGATRVDHAGKLAYGGQARTNFRVGWRYAPYWTWFAEVQNVLNRATIASTAGVLDLARNPAATAIFIPATSRLFAVGVEWRR